MSETLLEDGVVHFDEVRTEKPKRSSCPCPRPPVTGVQAAVLGTVVVILISVCIVLEVVRKPKHEENASYHLALVEAINSAGLTWKAKYNPFASRSYNEEKDFIETENEEEDYRVSKPPKYTDGEVQMDTKIHAKKLRSLMNFSRSGALPDSFDARLKWPFCYTLHDVRNQGGCGSCWAISAAAVISDRICIHSNGSIQSKISTFDILTCCSNCSGCAGEMTPIHSFLYWKKEGVVSGGGYGSLEGCKPYPYPSQCGMPCSLADYRSQVNKRECRRVCQKLYYHKSYEEDKHYGSSVYDLQEIIESERFEKQKFVWRNGWADMLKAAKQYQKQGIALLKLELTYFGPVHACFTVSEDFQHYKSGVYQRFSEDWKVMYGHCVKLIGWGVEKIRINNVTDNVPYWIAVNSWGRDWGDHGTFRLHMNETPTELIGGLP